MSFWSDLGEKAKNGLVGAWDAARAAAPAVQNALNFGIDVDEYNQNKTVQAVKPVVNKPIQWATYPVVWAGNQVSHAAATGLAIDSVNNERYGDAGLGHLFDKQSWATAWDATRDVEGGQALTYIATPGREQNSLISAGIPSQQFVNYQSSTAGKILGGAADIAITWFADPTIVLGKAAKLSRAANRVEDAAKAEDISRAFQANDLAANPVTKSAARRGPRALLSNSSQESATRFSRMIASTDDMSTGAIAAHLKPVLERSPAAASIVDLLGQAGQIADKTAQRQVKADVMLTAMGSTSARERLVDAAPQLARAVERASFAPEEFAVFDRLSANAGELYRAGDSITEAARQLATPGNEKEVIAFGQRLDQIHRHMRDLPLAVEDGGALEFAGMSALDRAKSQFRQATAHEFYYQEGSSSQTVRVLHWAANQRSRGTVATSDAFRGHEELMDHLTRSKLYTGAERRAISDKWYKANGQSLRNKVVDDLWDDMIRRAAKKNGMTKAQADGIIAKVAQTRKSGSQYVAAEMEKARAANQTRVVLRDPATNSATSVDRSLLETHLRDNVALPDTQLIERLIRHTQDAGTLGDKVRKVEEGLLDGLNVYNDVWRLTVLARPGLFFRTQLDTQARAVAMIGATAAMKNAVLGLGHTFGKVRNRDDLIKVAMRAEDHLKHESLLDEADELRRKAEFQSGDNGAELLARADQIEAEANSLAERWINPNRLGAKPRTERIAGQDVEIPAAYADESDRYATWNATLPGDAKLSDALTVLSEKSKAKFIEDKSAGFVTKLPEDADWAASYVRALDPILGSHAGRKILEGLDLPTVDLVRMLREDDKVRKNWLDVRFDNPEFDDWIERSIAHVRYMAPTKDLRRKLLSGVRPSPAHIERNFKPRGALSAQQVAERRAPLEERVRQAEQALADHMEQPLHTKQQRALREALEQKVEKAKAALDDLTAELPEGSDSPLLDRMPIAGPSFSPLFSEGRGKNPLIRLLQKSIVLMSDQPDIVLARHPVYVNRFHKHYRELAARHIERHGVLDMNSREAEVINKTAKHRAIKDVQQVMYDTARYTGGHAGLMKIVSSFLNAWEDAMISWSRLMYDDPARLGALVKTWNAPERLSMITDENGDVIRPGQTENRFGRPIRQKFFTIPMAGPLADWTGVKSLKIRKDGLNSIFQGEVPWLPGFGPTVAIPAQQVVARSFPELGDPSAVPAPLRPFVRSLLNGDAPKYRYGVKGLGLDVLEGGLEPAYVKKLVDAFDTTSPAYTNVFQDVWNSEIIKANKEGRKPDYKAIEKKALRSAHNTQIIKGLALWGFGFSGEGAGEQEFYANAYKQMSRNADEYHAKGTTVEQEFNKAYPEAANLNFSVSINNTGIQAFLKTEDRAKEFAKNIAANPAYGWFYVGEDNLPAAGKDEFSASIYNAQSSRQLAPGSRHTERERLSPAEMIDENMKSQGWGQYQSFMTRLDTIVEKQGLSDYTDDPRLKQIRDDFVNGLRAENKQWAQDYDNFDSGALRRFVDDVATPALRDPRLKDRGDIKLLGQYLALRQRATDIAKAQGFTLAAEQDAAGLRKVLATTGQQMARDNLAFEQIWQRVLSREVM